MHIIITNIENTITIVLNCDIVGPCSLKACYQILDDVDIRELRDSVVLSPKSRINEDVETPLVRVDAPIEGEGGRILESESHSSISCLCCIPLELSDSAELAIIRRYRK